MYFSLAFQICLVSILWCFVCANKMVLPVAHYLRSKAFAMFHNAKQTEFIIFVWACFIACVQRLVGFPKIHNSIVGFDSIDMVNKSIWPFSINIQPRKPMRLVTFTFNADNNIPVSYRPSSFSNASAIIVSLDKICEMARKLVVLKNSFQIFGGKISRIHDDSLTVRLARHPVTLVTLLGVAHFIMQVNGGTIGLDHRIALTDKAGDALA
jgi:hypothetical protein